MKTIISRISISLLLIFMTTASYASDLPSEFDQIINDNPTDAPIEMPVWAAILVFGIILFLFFKFKNKNTEA